jgi:hypothetical protein
MNNIANFRIATTQLPEANTIPAVEQSIHIQKPHPQEFIQTHAEQFPAEVIHWYQDDRYYLVHPEMRRELESETKLVRLTPFIKRSGEVGLWPVTAFPSTWQASAQVAIAQARTQWGRIKSNKSKEAYDFLAATSALGAPQWSDKPVDELVAMAFGNRLIMSADHPVVMALRGEQGHA